MVIPIALSQVPRNAWVLEWPGQVVIFWTREVSEALVEDTLTVSEHTLKLAEGNQHELG